MHLRVKGVDYKFLDFELKNNNIENNTMKKNKNVSMVALLVATWLLGLIGPNVTLAATNPSLGTAATFGILSSTYTNTVGGTTINGDLGYTTGPAVAPTVSGTTHQANGTYNQAGTDQNAALSNLNSQACDFTFGSATDLSLLPQPLASGVYCVTGAASIGSGGITLNGSGTYIFRISGALTTAANSSVTFSGPANACNLFWTPTQATTLGANSTFGGTNIDAAGITIGSTVTWTGRALAFGGTVSTDTDTITVPSCAAPVPPSAPSSNNNTITVVKTVINNNGGTAMFSDFPLFINGNAVTSGQSVSLTPGLYTITETTRANYTATFGGDCNASGQVNHGGINTQNNICTITNDDIGTTIIPVVPPLIDVVKVPSPLALPNGPGPVTYTYTLRNIGTVPMTAITMVGDTCSPITLVSGDMNSNSILDLNEMWTYTCSTNLSATHTNTVTATGWANGISANDVASATVVVSAPIVPPLIHVTKIPNPLVLGTRGGLVTYTYRVTNPGTVALSNVKLTDDKCPVSYVSGDTNSNGTLDTTETWSFTCKSNLTRNTTNTAVATGQANGLTARDFAITTVLVPLTTPTLPNTGFAPAEEISWNFVMLAGILALISASLVVLRRSKITN